MGSLGDLLISMDDSSRNTHIKYSVTGTHCSLEDFDIPISFYRDLEDTLRFIKEPSPYEKNIIADFYSALAFRILDTSTIEDNEKFDKYQEIINRAYILSSGASKNCSKAIYYALYKQDSILGINNYSILDKISSFLTSCCFDDYFKLFHDAIWVTSLLNQSDLSEKYKENKKIQRVIPYLKQLGLGFYEGVRSFAFMSATFVGMNYLSAGKYKQGLIALGISSIIPLSRYFLRQYKKKNLLGDYPIPKLKPVKIQDDLYEQYAG